MTKKSIILGIIVLLWMGFIFIMSSDNGEDSGRKSSEIVNYIISKYDQITNASDETIKYHQSNDFIDKANYIFRKICHFSEYFILSILLISFFISLNKFKLLNSSIYAILISFIYALLDEFHQTFVNGRGGNIIDSLIDTSGAIVAVLIIIIFYYFRNKKLEE